MLMAGLQTVPEQLLRAQAEPGLPQGPWLLAGNVFAVYGERVAAQDPAFAWTRVTYLSGNSVYVDAGTRDGVREGSRLEVVRGGVVVADLDYARSEAVKRNVDVTVQPLNAEDRKSVV